MEGGRVIVVETARQALGWVSWSPKHHNVESDPLPAVWAAMVQRSCYSHNGTSVVTSPRASTLTHLQGGKLWLHHKQKLYSYSTSHQRIPLQSRCSHVDVGLIGYVVRLRVPETATSHAYTLSSLFSYNHLNHVLVPCKVHLCGNNIGKIPWIE